MARIDRFTTRTQAELAAGFLHAHGFDARVSADDAGGVRPEIAFGIGGTVVVVPDHQLEEALALLDAVVDPPSDEEMGLAPEGEGGPE